MRNFKGIISQLLICLGFLCLFVGTGKAFRFLLIDDADSYTRKMMHELHNEKDIDGLLVGSSHCYSSLDPEILNEETGLNWFNSGSSLQAMDASYAVIREAADGRKIKQVWLEMFYKMSENDEYEERTQMTGTYIISDYMKPSFHKLQFLLKASNSAYYINSFIPARRNWEKLSDISYIQKNAKKKLNKNYLFYTEDHGPFGYQGKGFVAGEGTVPGNLYFDNAGFDRIHIEKISHDWLESLQEIIDYCKSHEIDLILFSAPMADFQLIGVGNYDEYIDTLRRIAAENGVKYVDFNLVRTEYLNLTGDHYADAGHLNADGAQVFTKFFADYVNEKNGDTDLFYDRYEEKINELGEKLFGFAFQDEGSGIRNIKIISTLPAGTRYRVECTNGFFRESSDELFFQMDPVDHGSCSIQYQTENGQMETETISY